jgi:hypothetical protein
MAGEARKAPESPETTLGRDVRPIVEDKAGLLCADRSGAQAKKERAYVHHTPTAAACMGL